ncbi:MAG: hypothetical protein LBD75_07395 [Candidatus Peribacteria bacterium]|nr:hypothetical protein [Candidatus Peribacteria bacterium]
MEEIPADLRKLIYDEVASVITTGGMQARIASESVSGTSITYRFETTPAKEAVLSKYRNINV